MKLKEQLKALDKLVEKGEIIDAFQKYFDDNVVTWDSDGQKTTTKAEKTALLKSFFSEYKNTEKIKLHDSIVDGLQSHSEFTFIFSNENGQKHKWHEIISRTWKDGKVIDEFYSKGNISDLKKNIEKAQKETKKLEKKEPKEKPKKEGYKKPKLKNLAAAVEHLTEVVEVKTLPKVKTPKEVKPLPKKATPVAAVKSTVDNLKLIEGIGPKMEEILNEAKISNFKELASATPEKLQEILQNAGNRYAVQNPSTWAMQAKLAEAGKWEELDNLKKRIVKGVLQD
jgi:predicted flap endonuclease-1-like 5' DNA nuclease